MIRLTLNSEYIIENMLEFLMQFWLSVTNILYIRIISMAEIENLSFEEALGELESLVRRLEEGKCPLDEAVKTFERGIILKNFCDSKLKDARLKIEQILANPDGSISTKPFLTEDIQS